MTFVQPTGIVPMTKVVRVTDGEWSSIDFELTVPNERAKYLRVYVADEYMFFFIGDKPEFVENLTIRSSRTVYTLNYSDPPPNTVTSYIAYAGANILTMQCEESKSERTFSVAPCVRFLRVNKN